MGPVAGAFPIFIPAFLCPLWMAQSEIFAATAAVGSLLNPGGAGGSAPVGPRRSRRLVCRRAVGPHGWAGGGVAGRSGHPLRSARLSWRDDDAVFWVLLFLAPDGGSAGHLDLRQARRVHPHGDSDHPRLRSDPACPVAGSQATHRDQGRRGDQGGWLTSTGYELAHEPQSLKSPLNTERC